MKRKFFVHSIFIILFSVLVFGGLIIKPKQLSNAETISFDISNSSSGYADVSKNSEPLSCTATNFDELLVFLNQNSNNDDEIKINFSNFVLPQNETINFSSGNYTLSGTLSSETSASVILVDASSALTLNLDGLTITANNSQNLIEVKSTCSNVSLVINSCTFNSSKNNSRAILFNSSNHTLSLAGNTVHQTTYLFNFKEGLTTTSNSELTNTTMLKIEIPYNANGSVVYNSSSVISNYNKVELVASDEFVTVNQNIINDLLQASVSVGIDFDLNGGTLASGESLATSFDYKSIYGFSFPSSAKLSKAYSIFGGWFGKITIDDETKSELDLSTNTLYFDSQTLNSFINSNYDFSQLSETLETLSSDNSFASYAYDNTQSNLTTFKNIDVFLKLGLKPEFIAKWTYNTYTITFISNGGTPVEPIIAKFNDTITAPTSPTKTGYNFVGWLEDQTNTESIFVFNKMTTNKTLYASWSIKNISVTFVFDNGTANSTVTSEYNSPLTLPVPTKTGANFLGWFEDISDDDTRFTETSMPAENVTLYAKWEDIIYTIYFDTDGGTKIANINAIYNAPISRPSQDPTKTGHTFLGWFDSKSFENEYVFDKMPLGGDFVYAKWKANTYTITLMLSEHNPFDTITKNYGTDLSLPTDVSNSALKKANHNFLGWFEDTSNTNTKFNQTTMPNKNVTLYALWKQKATVSIVEDTQNFTTNQNIYYQPNSSLSGFIVEYLVNNTWIATAPTEAGVYDIKITRNEDDTYSSFEKIITGGLVVTKEVQNFSWLIVLFFVLGFMEIITTIIVKVMQKMKTSPKSIVPFMAFLLPITTSQFVWIIVSGVFALVCFVVLIYEIVKLHKLVPAEEKELVNKNQIQIEALSQKETEESSSYEKFSKYSADDIEKILNDDNFEKDLKLRNSKYNPDKKADDNEEIYSQEDDLHEEVEYYDDDDNELHENVEYFDDDEDN